jgi:hypothetical protein
MRPRKHVLSDLQPYICTYPDCQLNDYFFENKDDWYNHESRTHRVEWFCNTASHKSFVDMQEFLDHMHTVHSEPLEGAQLLSLHRGFQRPSNAHSGTCTLCGQHANKLKSHLARHLEQLALFAIPQTDYMADLEEDDTSSNAARQGVPAPSSLESARKASETSSLEPSSGVPSVSIEYGNPLIENTETAQRHESYYKEIPENLEDDMGEGIDTSWDQITPKFKEARHAMYNEHEAGVSEPYKTPSGVWGVAPSNASTTSIPSGGEIVQSKFAQALKTQSGPASSLESIQKQPTLQRREESRGAPKPPPLSLRQRAGRFTSNILSPFRSRKESQPADGFYLPKERSASMEALYEPEWSPTIEIISKAKAPISELWPDTTPAELYSPPAELHSPPPEGRETVDYFAASRTRRQGAPRTPIAELPGEDAISSLPKKNEDLTPREDLARKRRHDT